MCCVCLPGEEGSDEDVNKQPESPVQNGWRPFTLLLLLDFGLGVRRGTCALLSKVDSARLLHIVVVTVVEAVVLGAGIRNYALFGCGPDRVYRHIIPTVSSTRAVVHVLVVVLMGNVESGVVIVHDTMLQSAVVGGHGEDWHVGNSQQKVERSEELMACGYVGHHENYIFAQ